MSDGAAYVLADSPIVEESHIRRQKNCALNASSLSGASFLSKTAQDEILLASVRLGSSYSQKASHSQKLDFLARAAQITDAAASARA